MDGELAIGTEIKTILSGQKLRIIKLLGEGGQGSVYLVDYNGEQKALKWYKKTGHTNSPDNFYRSIKGKATNRSPMDGMPNDIFLWPLDVTEWHDGTFGYIMDLRPAGYYDLTQFMLTHVRFSSYRAAIDAALAIVNAFRILHNKGYAYQDLNDGNFFIDPQTGSVRICDNDNVDAEGSESGILGKPRYMAPEIVLGQKMPDSYSDRFSMSVILYILFCMNHPLEGKRYLVPGLSPELQKKLYGSEALFMWDPDDNSNAPHPKIHKNSRTVWPCLPQYIKDIFVTAFSQKALKKPSARPREIDWLKALTRFRSDIVVCTCGNEDFTENGRPCVCDVCKKKIDIQYRLDLRDYSIPALRGSRIYRCQLGVCDDTEALTPVAQVVEKKDQPGMLGIRNKSDRKWDAVTPSGKTRYVSPDEVIPMRDGITFTAFDEKMTISANN